MAARPTPRRQGTGRFDHAALRALAGDAVFSRGEAYAREERVEILSDDGTKVRARVTGSARYRCELRGGGKKIDGTCSCPAFTDHGFCKHLVATALAATAAAATGLPIPDRFDAVRAYLRNQGEARLIEMILNLADRDPALLDRLEIAASAAAGDPDALGKRLEHVPFA